MKRKIAAILAADIAGYSKLVAEDEEETLRRLATARAVFDDFVVRGSGRVFNTAGDAILADFSSAVEAVRCAIDVQESLRTRNLAYPTSRQMSFRIGITIGDVVERDGDLLGDGVNIAARLQTLAPPGGLCISRTVYEQVANKLSVEFADIGEQEVKNIPTPVHAYALALGSDGSGAPARSRGKPAARHGRPWIFAASAALAALALAGIVAAVYVAVQQRDRSDSAVAVLNNTGPARPPVQKRIEPLVPEIVPRIADRGRVAIRDEYVPAPDHKALAISGVRLGFISGQPDDEMAKRGALDACQRNSDRIAPGYVCEIYAVGDTVIYERGRAPMPPQPWFTHDPSVERPFVYEELPLVSGQMKRRASYLELKKSKAVAIGPGGTSIAQYGQTSPEEAVRRSLENCGFNAGVPCLIVAVDDMFVVPIPTTMKATGFFSARRDDIAPELRETVAQRLGAATGGWSAVAVGSSGHPGLATKAASEPDAINAALADCAKRDRNCHVVAIGPFAVEPK
jgi:class 3 adenylate cyclase